MTQCEELMIQYDVTCFRIVVFNQCFWFPHLLSLTKEELVAALNQGMTQLIDTFRGQVDTVLEEIKGLDPLPTYKPDEEVDYVTAMKPKFRKLASAADKLDSILQTVKKESADMGIEASKVLPSIDLATSEVKRVLTACGVLHQYCSPHCDIQSCWARVRQFVPKCGFHIGFRTPEWLGSPKGDYQVTEDMPGKAEGSSRRLKAEGGCPTKSEVVSLCFSAVSRCQHHCPPRGSAGATFIHLYPLFQSDPDSTVMTFSNHDRSFTP